MSLIEYPDPSKLSENAQRILEKTPLPILRMMAGSGVLFEPLTEFALSFLRRGALAPTLREAVTCRIAFRLEGSYVLQEHSQMGRKVGLTETQMEALKGSLPSKEFTEMENAALQLVDAQVDTMRPPKDLVLKAYETLGETAFHELLLVSGFYHLAVRYTEAIRLEHDDA